MVYDIALYAALAILGIGLIHKVEKNCMKTAARHATPSRRRPSSPMGISWLVRPVAVDLDQGNVVKALWYIHVLACCLGIAYLAFSKMFHIISTPVSLVVAEISAKKQEPAAVATRQVIELQGCGHEGCPVRRRRLERIDECAAFEPMFLYLGKKSLGDLGSRQVSG